ncbi:phage protein [Streptococcus pyogenes]|uniref:DUF1642 domain-containing protein n=1 Tax=Streptococcus pyogenes TaxID=1314 RepID=UPI00051473EE|nr:DUF1642 domain-containing protein [Streptococcus pyogenes]KGE61122.1 hypothetical protein MGAS2111_0282 [Streptococcus pyogenes MGAS2111]KGE61069.1 hypothetical protein SPYSS1447_1989 [Streptococcus pyogenes SS1447]QTH61896.1 DUF1642 domain-containing protein [Streptococcus pyogenes]SUO64192.1 phage protein [Streptococcus pyogenes]VHF04165.1 phage protein [Streptococcus pyogenes]
MNIEEAKKIVDKLSVDSDELWKIPMIPAHKVKALLDTLDQPKPEVPQFVAECLEEDKKRNLVPSQYTNEVFEWMKEDNNAFVYLDAWVNGYTVKKEKKYKVRDKRLSPNQNYLNFDKNSECWFFSNGIGTLSLNASHTRKALEESGFNVFDDDNYEVIEVTE